MEDKTTLFEFPCLFPIKIIGDNSATFLEEIKGIILQHFPEITEEDLSSQISKQGKYLAITLKVLAKDKASLDAFYQAVTQHPGIKMVL